MKLLSPIPEERLYDLLLGKVSEPEFERLSREVENDSRISSIAMRIQNQPDSFLSELRGASPLDRPEFDTKAQRVLRSLSVRKSPDAAITLMIDQTLKSEGFAEKVAIPKELEHFRILKKLGEGGMGTVYEAQDTRLNRSVALKVLRPELLSKPDAKQRLLREARSVAGLSHDNILTIHHVGEVDGNIYFVMPILEGETLADRLKRKQILSVNECTKFGTQIAQGLKYAHDQGIVHRDIKPANIWLETKLDDRIKILDFGLARKNQGDATITTDGTIVGTPAYMAPEQTRSGAVDPRADLFSLGVILYELSTGKRPFVGDDTLSVLTSIAVDEPAAPHRVNPNIPKSYSDLVMKLLEKKTIHRLQNANEVLEELQAIGSVQPVLNTQQNRLFSKGLTGIALGLLFSFFVIGLGFGVYKLSFATKEGTILVEADENADIRFRKGKLEIYDEAGKLVYTLQGSEKNKTLPEGKYLLKVIDAKGVETESPELLVKKGEETKVRVQVVADNKENPIGKGVETQDRKWAEWVITTGGGGVEIRRGRREITKVEDLPNDAFEVTGIRIEKNVPAESLLRLGKAPDLLKLETKEMNDELIKAFGDCKSLKTLRCKSAIGLTPKGYALLKNFNQLEVLDLALVSSKNEDYEFLKSLPQLKVLNLSDGLELTDDWSENLKNINGLEEFRIARIPVRAGALQKISGMKSLRVVVFQNIAFGEGEFARISGLTELEQLNLANSTISDADMMNLQKLTKLRGLDLFGTKVTDNGLKNIADCKELQVLNLNGGITDDVIPMLKEFSKLRSVSSTNFTKDGAEDLAKTLPECEIEYNFGKITPVPKKKPVEKPVQTQDRKWAEWVIRSGGGGVEINGIEKEITKLDDLPEEFELTGIRIDYSIQSSSLLKLGKCPNLEKLQTRYADDEMIKALEDCKYLKCFKTISALSITTNGYNLMKKFKRLEVLDLYLIQAKDSDFQFLSELKQLKILNMAGANDLKGKWLEYLKENKSLEELRITTSPLGEGTLKSISGMKSLKVLVLSNMQFVRGELSNIAGLTDLEFLNLSNTKLIDEEMVHLKKLTKLKGLDLQQTQITDEGLKNIADCKQLEVLNLNGVITNDAIPILKEFKKLRSVSFTSFTKEGAEELAKTLPGCEISYDKGKIYPPFKKIRP